MDDGIGLYEGVHRRMGDGDDENIESNQQTKQSSGHMSKTIIHRLTCQRPSIVADM